MKGVRFSAKPSSRSTSLAMSKTASIAASSSMPLRPFSSSSHVAMMTGMSTGCASAYRLPSTSVELSM